MISALLGIAFERFELTQKATDTESTTIVDAVYEWYREYMARMDKLVEIPNPRQRIAIRQKNEYRSNQKRK